MSSLGDLMKHLERSISWSAVSDEWRGMRKPWLSSVDDARTAQDLANLLIVLGQAMKPEVMASRWSRMADKWERKLRRTSSYVAVGRMLEAFEMHITWPSATKSSSFLDVAFRREWRSQIRDASKSLQNAASDSSYASISTGSAGIKGRAGLSRGPRSVSKSSDGSSLFGGGGPGSSGSSFGGDQPPDGFDLAAARYGTKLSKTKSLKGSKFGRRGDDDRSSDVFGASDKDGLAAPPHTLATDDDHPPSSSLAVRSPLLRMRQTKRVFYNSANRQAFLQELIISSMQPDE